jgi:hypothetical protein
MNFYLEKYTAIPNFTLMAVRQVYEFGTIIKEVIYC